MGLIEKAAVVMVFSISSQIVCSHCMPRNHSKLPLKTNITKSQNDISMKNKVLCKRFPNVEYPLDSDLGEYYRFLNDYPVQWKPKEYVSNSSCQVNTNKIEANYKRKLNKVTNTKARHQITTSIAEDGPRPQPHCFRKSSFFPEVEYPLSARDMWIQKSWSQLQDQIPSNNIVVSNNDTDYENSSLNTLIRTLNTKKTPVIETSNKDINAQPNTNESDDIFDVIISITPSVKNTNTMEPLPNETISTVSSKIKNAITSTTLPRNLSRPIDKISSECSGITITPEFNPSTNIFTPSDDYYSILSMVPDIGYSDITEATTAVPFECITSPMSISSTLTNDIVFDQSTTTAPNPILTTNQPSSLSGIPTLSNSYQDYAITANESPPNALDIDQGNFTKKLTLNSNESFTTCQLLPEDSDDWVIYVDTEKTIPSKENFSDYTMIGDEDTFFTYFDTLSCCLGDRPQITQVLNSTLLTPDGRVDERYKSDDVPKNMPNDFPVLDTTNTVKTITETGYVDLSNSLTSSCLNENNGSSCANSASFKAQLENGESREISTDTSITVPAVNTNQVMTGNEYEPISSMIESNADEESILKGIDIVDQILYFEDSNSTLQCEYIDDASSSFTEIPCDLIL